MKAVISTVAVLLGGSVIGSNCTSPLLRIKDGLAVIDAAGKRFSINSVDLKPSPFKNGAKFVCLVYFEGSSAEGAGFADVVKDGLWATAPDEKTESKNTSTNHENIHLRCDIAGL